MTTKLSRRDFIKITAVAGGALISGKIMLDLFKEEYVTVRETRVLMGTIINLAVVAESRSDGEKAVSATFTEMERQTSIFNHRESASPVSVLNLRGEIANPPRELVEVLDQAVKISNLTNGAFDVTIKPLLDLYQQTQPDLPVPEAIAQALSLVGYRDLILSADMVSFARPGMAVTLDGIAKGYIVDAGTAELKSKGYENIFVEAGGDLMATGRKSAESPWRVGVQSPREQQPGILAKLDVSNQAVATSGDYKQFFSRDLSHHHIIDPRVGASPTELASVTIASKSAMLSDALATAVMVLGPDAGLNLIEASPDVEGLLITKKLGQIKSSGFYSS